MECFITPYLPVLTYHEHLQDLLYVALWQPKPSHFHHQVGHIVELNSQLFCLNAKSSAQPFDWKRVKRYSSENGI